MFIGEGVAPQARSGSALCAIRALPLATAAVFRNWRLVLGTSHERDERAGAAANGALRYEADGIRGLQDNLFKRELTETARPGAFCRSDRTRAATSSSAREMAQDEWFIGFPTVHAYVPRHPLASFMLARRVCEAQSCWPLSLWPASHARTPLPLPHPRLPPRASA